MPEESRPPRFRRTKLVLLTLTPVTLLLVLAEAVATVTISRRASVTPDSATGQWVYTMRIGKWPWSRRTTIPLNSLKMPDREFPAPGSKHACTHVVFSGDSYVFGDGVDRDSNFVEIVRRRVAARPNSGCIRIFNIGQRGTSIDMQGDRLRLVLDRLQPDVVILGQYQNDLTDLTNPGAILNPKRPPPGNPGRDSVRVRLSILNANIIRWLTYQSFAGMIRNGIKRDLLKRWSVLADSSRKQEAVRLEDTYERLYRELATSLRSRGIAFGVLILPSKLDVLAGRYPEEAFFMDLAKRYDVPYLRLFPVFDAARSPYPFLMYDGHLNEQGNRMIAGALFDWLFTTEPAPFPVLRAPPK